jgi:hypothetical protein
MPALTNPRHEAFAQAIFKGLDGKTRQERAASTAYLTAYPNCSNGNSAEAAASRLLRRVKPILDRVLELQAEQAKRTQRKIDISRDRIARNLDLASAIVGLSNPSSEAINAAIEANDAFVTRLEEIRDQHAMPSVIDRCNDMLSH